MTTACDDCLAGSCRWWCPIHLEHHPVADMVSFCKRKASNNPAPSPTS